MAGYGGGYGQSRHGLMVEEEDDEDLYEGFNFSIDLAPPQTAATTNYMSSSYGAPASRGATTRQEPRSGRILPRLVDNRVILTES